MRGLEGGLVQTRGSAVSEAAAITELVIVEAIRTSDSWGEATWEPSDDMSGGGRGRECCTWEPPTYRSRLLVKHEPNQIQVKSSPVL